MFLHTNWSCSSLFSAIDSPTIELRVWKVNNSIEWQISICVAFRCDMQICREDLSKESNINAQRDFLLFCEFSLYLSVPIWIRTFMVNVDFTTDPPMITLCSRREKGIELRLTQVAFVNFIKSSCSRRSWRAQRCLYIENSRMRGSLESPRSYE